MIPQPMNGNEIEVMLQLFLNGPTWDGNIVSKQGRGELFNRGWAARVNGWSFLTKEGMEIAVYAGLPEEKERRENARRRAA